MIKIRKKSGYALVTVLGIMAVLGIVFTMLIKTGQQGVFTGKLLKDRIKATAYAEAGIEFAYAILRDNYDKRTDLSAFLISTNTSEIVNTTVETTYGDGSYVLKITNLDGGQYVIINSIGHCRASSVEVEAMVEDTTFGSGNAWDMGAYGGGIGTSRIGGGGVVDSSGNRQTVHCNGDINCNGGASINANVNSGGIIAGDTNVQGTPKNNQPHISPPTLESRYKSFSQYESIANEVWVGDFDFGHNKLNKNQPQKSNSSWNLLYVDGNVTINSGYTYTGTIICTGTVSIKGSINKGSSGIAVATQGGSISLNTQAACSGLFYAQIGDFNQQAQGIINGQIIVGGVFNKTGGGDIYFEGGSIATPEANPIIAGWQK